MSSLELPELTDADRHHLLRVLRVRDGEPITVCDGAGSWRRCRFGRQVDPDGEVHTEARPTPPVSVAFALAKGERPEWAVQKLTELGVDVIVPVETSRSVVRWEPDRARSAVARLRRVAREAAMQSRRLWLPGVGELEAFAVAAARAGAVLAERGGAAPALDGEVTVLVGPEGGWDETERETGLATVSLGTEVLRIETAAVAAGTLFCALRAGIVRQHHEREH